MPGLLVIQIQIQAMCNNGPLPAQSTFIAQIFIELFGNFWAKNETKEWYYNSNIYRLQYIYKGL